MAYKKQTWKDEILASPERYRIEQDGRITHPSASIELITDVKQAASPVNAARMNHIENGIGQHEADITNVTTAYKSADTAITTAYKAADSALDGRLTTLNNDIYYQSAWQGMGVPSSLLSAGTGSQARYRRIGRMIEFQIINYYFEYYGPSTAVNSPLVFKIEQAVYQPLHQLYFPVSVWQNEATGNNTLVCHSFISMGTAGDIYFCFRSSAELPGNMLYATVNIGVTGTYPAAVTVK